MRRNTLEKDIRTGLNDYYRQMNIYPDTFHCPHKCFCEKFADQEMTEAKMSMVGSLYGKIYPRITVVSLDPPKGREGAFKSPATRKTEFISEFHESEDYFFSPPNIHWAMTQIIVKDILIFWGYPVNSLSAVVDQSYSGRKIENVSAYFSHVNVAKCSMNKNDKGQANFQVHKKCGYSFLLKELEILMPEVIVSQGKNANKIMSNLFKMPGVEDSLPAAKKVHIGRSQTLWLPMDHPSHHTGEIRLRWTFYVDAIKNWIFEKSANSIIPLSTDFSLIDQPASGIQPSTPETSTESLTQVIVTEPGLGQSGFSDFGLYKCLACSKMVMGFEKRNHEREIHGGKTIEWKKIK